METGEIYNKALQIEEGLRKVILIELVLPMVLLILGIYHGFVQALYRSGIINSSSFLGIEYYQGLTLHGVINVLIFTTFFAIAFGNAMIRYSLEKPISVIRAKVSMILMVVGTISAAIPIFAGKASVLYTFYPPLRAHPAFYFGLTLLVVGSWVGFFNWIPAYRAWKKENPGKKTPLAVVGVLTTFIVWFIATLPVAYEIIVLLIPWSLGWTQTVNAVLARMLFWAFGHALVYFWILPAYVMYYTMLPKLCGGKLYSDFAGRFTFMWFIVYSAPIGIHHQFSDPGIRTTWKFLHTFLTMLVALPSFATAFTLAASMEHGAKQRGGKGLFSWWSKLPYLDQERWLFGYLFSGLVIFILGGITGIINGSYNMNSVVHNTSWVPAHFHQTVGGPTLLAFIGMSLLLVSKLTGKEIRYQRINVWVPYLWTLGVMIFSIGLFVGGIGGEPRRTNMGLSYTNPQSPLYHADWAFAKTLGSLGATIMFVSMVLYFAVFFKTLFSPREEKEALQFTISEPYHDERISAVQSFKPWIVGAVVLWIIAYGPPFYELVQNGFQGAPGFTPDSPVAVPGR